MALALGSSFGVAPPRCKFGVCGRQCRDDLAARRKIIAALPSTHPELAAEWGDAKRRAEGESHLLRSTGRYPLCGVGDVNTYSVFAEHMRSVIAIRGRMGVITPVSYTHLRAHET